MVLYFIIAQSETVVDFAATADALTVSIDIFTTCSPARAIQARNDLRFKKSGGHYLSHLLLVTLDALAVFLDGAFPAYAFFCIFTRKRNIVPGWLVHFKFPLLTFYGISY